MHVSLELNFMITTPVFQLYPWSQVVIDHKSQATIILSLYIYSYLHYTMSNSIKVCKVQWSYISYVLLLQTAQYCPSASGSKGGREESMFPKRLAPNIMSLASSFLMTPQELRSTIWSTSTEKMLSVSTQRSSRSGLLEGESSR